MQIKLKTFFAIAAVFMLIGQCSSGFIEPDEQHQLNLNKPHDNLTGQLVTVAFKLPRGSPGVNYKQFIAIQFSEDLATELAFDQSAKFTCTSLTDGSTTFGVTAVAPIASPIVTSVLVQKNVAYCQLTDMTNTLLKAQVSYRLTISLANKITSTRYFRSIGVYTTSANNPEGVIIDSIPNIGNLGQYGDYSAYSPKALDISSVSVTVTSGPSSTNSGTVIYPYNSFDLSISLKSNDFLYKDDLLVVFKYPTDTASPATSISTTQTAANDPLQVALSGTLSISTFSTDSLALNGIGEDLKPNRQFTLNLRGWRALDTNIGTAKALEVWVYYKNTYSVISYATNNVFSVTKTTLTSNGVDHIEYWDIFQNAAWPFKFDFKVNSDLSNGAYIVIQQTNTKDSQSKFNFVASTCDFSANDSSFDQSFGKRPICFPLRNDLTYASASSATTYNGSGIFFWLSSVLSTKTYQLVVWGFADSCGTGRDPITDNANSFTQFQFNIKAYKGIDATKQNEARFTSQTVIGESSAYTQGGKCWGAAVTGAAIPMQIADEQDKSKTVVSANGVGNVILVEATDMFISNITDAATCTGCWILDIFTNAPTRSYIYSSTSAVTTGTSYLQFGGYFYLSAVGKTVRDIIPHAYGNGDKVIPGYLQLLVPRAWFIAGDGYATTSSPKGYVSWGLVAEWAVKASNKQINLIQADGAGSATAAFFGYNGGTNAGLDTSNTQLPPNVSATTGPNSVYRIRSVYDPATGNASTLHDFVKDQKLVSVTNAYVLLAFFTSYVKWASTLPVIKSTYTSIDIQFQHLTASTNSATPYVERVIRFIALYPQGGIFQDQTNKKSNTATPAYYHFTYGTALTADTGICLFELDGPFLSSSTDASTSTLVFFLFGSVLLETDYADAGATYPVAPTVSNITPYGNSSALPLSNKNGYSDVAETKGFNLLADTISIKTKNLNVPYMFYIASTVYLTGVSGSTVTTTATTGQPNLLIPFYCNPPAAGTYPMYRPIFVAQWINMSSYNSFTGVTKWLAKNTDVFVNLPVKKTTNVTAGTKHYATLRWAQYTSTATNASKLLYIHNGTKAAIGANDVNCTGFAWFAHSSLTVDAQASLSAAVATTVTPALHSYSKTFYVFGRSFNKAVLGANSTTDGKLTKTTSTTLSTTSTFVFTGINRPTVDKFTNGTNLIITDLVGFFCVSLTAANNNYISSFIQDTSGSNSISNFLIDYNPDLTTVWTGLNLSADKTEGVYKSDVAGSLKVSFTTPASVPQNGTITLSANNNSFTTNTMWYSIFNRYCC
jgi:hypothetical protein